MDDSQTALNDAPVASENSPIQEQQVPETVESETLDVATESVNETPETDSSSKGANARIRELNAEKKAAEEKAQSLADQLSQFTSSYGQGVTQYRPNVQPGAEITPEQYSSDVQQTANSMVELRLAEERALNRVEREGLDAVKKYPALDPDSDSYDKEISQAVTEAVNAQAKVLTGFDVRGNPIYRVNPQVSVSKIVDSLMKPYKKSIEKSVGQAEEEAVKRVNQTALRPTVVKAQEKSAKEMSKEELRAKLGVVHA